jgi:hypothetical protein
MPLRLLFSGSGGFVQAPSIFVLSAPASSGSNSTRSNGFGSHGSSSSTIQSQSSSRLVSSSPSRAQRLWSTLRRHLAWCCGLLGPFSVLGDGPLQCGGDEAHFPTRHAHPSRHRYRTVSANSNASADANPSTTAVI